MPLEQHPPPSDAEGAAQHLRDDGIGASSDSIDGIKQNGRPRTATTTSEIDTTLSHPGSVRINVKGAFIVDRDGGSPTATANGRSSPNGHHETKDIRLPYHTAVVSHIAIDVGLLCACDEFRSFFVPWWVVGRGGGFLLCAYLGFELSGPDEELRTSRWFSDLVQIGGSLAKLVYFSREAHSTEPGGRLNFLSFETDRIEDCLEFMRHLKEKQQRLNGSKPGELCVMATGGGAYKYYDMVRDALGVEVLREDEMECLIIGKCRVEQHPCLRPSLWQRFSAGLDFFITEIPREVFTYSETDPMHFASPSDDIYPYLLVNIGSGVSMLKVSGPREYERVGGTSLGGGTLWGLLSLLTGSRTFDEMLDLASKGDNSRVDMMVGDIYGTDYNKIGLKSTAIASSFGKVFRMKKEAESEAEDGVPTCKPDEEAENHHTEGEPHCGRRFSNADISRSLLYAISNNIGQIAFLQSQIHGLSHIYFGGSFIRGHPQTMNTLSYGLKFWSKGEKQAYFLRHEGYLGAVGAFLKRQPRNWGRRGSFEEALGVEARVRTRLGAEAVNGRSHIEEAVDVWGSERVGRWQH
jgi:type II pantothenate kinase